MFTTLTSRVTLAILAANYFCTCLGMVVVHLEKGGKEIPPITSSPKEKLAESTVPIHHNTSNGSVVQVLYMFSGGIKENTEIGDPENYQPDSAWCLEDQTRREELENEILFVTNFYADEEKENEQLMASLSGNDLEVVVSGPGIQNGSVNVTAKLAFSGEDKILVVVNKDMRAGGLDIRNESLVYKFGNIVLRKSLSFYGIPLKNPNNL